MKDLEYDEFEVVLERSGDGYSARVADSPTGPAPAMPFVQPMEIADLPPLRETMRGAEAEAPAGAERAAKVDVKAFGTALFRALFNDKAISIFRTSQYVAAKNGHGLRLRIRFSDVAELTNLPWELLYDPDRHKYLSQYRAFPTVRLLDLPDPVPPIKISGPLRMLVVISGPKDLPELDVENEWMLLREKLDPLVKAGRIDLVRLPVPTLDALRLKALAEEFHVFHFIGHGGIDASGEGYLSFIRPSGMQHKVPGSNLGVMLAGSPIRLAVLNSCHGGAVLAQDPYGSSAIALVEQGIPAVIAMQFQISDEAARTFSRTLYDSVAAGRAVDVGVTLGRQALLATSDSEWATPVLYLRGEDWVLFELKGGPVDTILKDPEEATPPQPGSQGESEPKPEPEPAPEPAPEPILVSPPAPSDLEGSVHEGWVYVWWEQEATADAPVLDWEVFRDGELISRVVSPKASDQPEKPGTYAYSVVAAGKGSLQSQPSVEWAATVTEPVVEAPSPTAPAPIPRPTPRQPQDEWIEVKARHVRRVPVAILLILALAVTAWLVVRPRGGALAAPTNVVAAFDTGLVSMTWDPAPADGPVVDHWEVHHGDTVVKTVREPKASFAATDVGRFEYRVVAVATDGKRAEAPPVAITVTAPPKPKPPTPKPAPSADLEVLVSDPRPPRGSATTITFVTRNFGPAKITRERVLIEMLGGEGRIIEASYWRQGTHERNSCTAESAEASCDIGVHGDSRSLIEVKVEWASGSTGLAATGKDNGGTKDPEPTDNKATYTYSPPPPEGGSSTTTESPDTTTTTPPPTG